MSVEYVTVSPMETGTPSQDKLIFKFTIAGSQFLWHPVPSAIRIIADSDMDKNLCRKTFFITLRRLICRYVAPTKDTQSLNVFQRRKIRDS